MPYRLYYCFGLISNVFSVLFRGFFELVGPVFLFSKFINPFLGSILLELVYPAPFLFSTSSPPRFFKHLSFLIIPTMLVVKFEIFGPVRTLVAKVLLLVVRVLVLVLLRMESFFEHSLLFHRHMTWRHSFEFL
eukprot:Lithocolla_globosa_v1_NODE_706_length_3411_cov_5.489425.p3 type:complete len:133 gc:universal NODE_706_length_3411_cov_5.489425:1466-1864(+)